MKILGWSLGVVAILIVVFLMADCSAGRTRYLECNVAGHQYCPAWVETRATTDSDGHTSISTIVHDEQFHVICEDLDSHRAIDVSTFRGTYYQVKDGDAVTVSVRQGRWTGGFYLPAILPPN